MIVSFGRLAQKRAPFLFSFSFFFPLSYFVTLNIHIGAYIGLMDLYEDRSDPLV